MRKRFHANKTTPARHTPARHASAHHASDRRPRGDTLIEVALALAVLSIVVISSITSMLTSLGTSEYSLQETMARAEIDIQAEALRYIHNAYTAQKDLTASEKQYENVWQAIIARVVSPDTIVSLNDIDTVDPANPDSTGTCDDFYANKKNEYSIFYNNAFIVNTRRLSTKFTQTNSQENLNKIIIPAEYNTLNPDKNLFQPSVVYPRILYNSLPNDSSYLAAASDIMGTDEANPNTSPLIVNRAEGIWIIVACDKNFSDSSQKCDSLSANGTNPEYYDFYIRTCWENGTDHPVSTLSSIIRLRNPDYITKRK